MLLYRFSPLLLLNKKMPYDVKPENGMHIVIPKLPVSYILFGIGSLISPEFAHNCSNECILVQSFTHLC